MTSACSPRAALRSAALGLMLAACAPIAPPPPTKITEAALVPRAGEDVLTLAQEDLRFVADRIEARRRSAASRVRDERLEAVLRDLGCRLAPERCPRLRAVVYEAIYPVLRVWPNDLIEVATGALVRTTSEDELAALLAHELAHDGLRHRALAWEAVQRAAIPEIMRPATVIDPPMRVGARSPDAVPTLGANYTLSGAEYAVGSGVMVVAGVLSLSGAVFAPLAYPLVEPGVYPIPFDAPHQVTQLVFVPSLEAAAEAEAARRLANAGFDPAAAARFWERVAREPEAAGEIPYLRSFREIHALEGDHPPRTTVGGPPRRGGESQAWRAIVRARRSSWLAAEIEAGSWNRALHLVEAWRELDPEATDLLWARGEILRRRDETGDRAAALADLERAVRDPRAPAAAFRSLGLLLDREGRTAEAARAYRGYLERAPFDADAPLLRARLARGHWGTAEPATAPAGGESAPIERFAISSPFGGAPGSTPYGKIWSRFGSVEDVFSRDYQARVVFLTVVRQLPDGERLAPEHDPYAPSPGPAHWIRPIFPVALPHVFRATMNELELVDLFTTLFTAAGAWRAELVSAESVEIGVPGVRAEWRLVEPERGADDRVRAVFGKARGRLFAVIYRADAAGAWAKALPDAERFFDSFEVVPDPTPLQRALYQVRPW